MSHLPKFKKEVAVELKVGMIGNVRFGLLTYAAEVVKVDHKTLFVHLWYSHMSRDLGGATLRERILHAEFKPLPKCLQPKGLR